MKTSKQVKSSKPKPLNLVSYGYGFTIKCDSKMTNMWFQNIPIEVGKAKQMRIWLDKYIKYADELRVLNE